jgi:hypothetical protein
LADRKREKEKPRSFSLSLSLADASYFRWGLSPFYRHRRSRGNFHHEAPNI